MKLLHYNSTFHFTLWSYYRSINLDLTSFRNDTVFTAEFSPDFGHWERIYRRDSYVIFIAKKNRKSSLFNSICYLMTLLQTLSSESWWCFRKITECTAHSSMHCTDGLGKSCTHVSVTVVFSLLNICT